MPVVKSESNNFDVCVSAVESIVSFIVLTFPRELRPVSVAVLVVLVVPVPAVSVRTSKISSFTFTE